MLIPILRLLHVASFFLALIGKILILSPSFPPAHTVHEPFSSYGVPSPTLVTCGYSSTAYYHRFNGHATTLSQIKPGYMQRIFPGNASLRTNSLRSGLSSFRYPYLYIFARRSSSEPAYLIPPITV